MKAKASLGRLDWTTLFPHNNYPVIGVDEVGRGCLAGPVFASAVLFVPKHINLQELIKANMPYLLKREQSEWSTNKALKKISLSTLTQEDTYHYPDSKCISAEKRDQLARVIRQKHLVGVGISSVKEIERYNIREASLLAMKRAIFNLPIRKAYILVDGACFITDLPLSFHQKAFIKGDKRLSPIASASIVAKVLRDKHFVETEDKKYPQYGFAKHKGYPTQQHKKALAQYGPCPIHRRTFKGVMPPKKG